MNVFTCTEFDGFYPVGVAAVIVAPTAEDAAEVLEFLLKKHGIPQKISSDKMVRLKTNTLGGIVLCDGNY